MAQMGSSPAGLRAVSTVAGAAEIFGSGRSLAFAGIRAGWLPAIRLEHRLGIPHQVITAMVARPIPTPDNDEELGNA